MIRHFVLATLLLGSTSVLAGPMMKPSPAVSVDTRAKKPIVPFCVGKLNGNYWTAVSLLARMNRDVTVDPKTSQGALDNTELVDNGTCPFGLTQADTLREYRETHPGAENTIQRISALYREYGFLLCNRRANIKTVKDLHKGHVVAVGPAKSGSASTWEGLVETDKARFTDVKTSDQGDLDALTAVADGSEVSCMFFTGGIGNTLLKQQAPRMSSKVVLVPLTDSDFSKIKDAKGDPVYQNESIPKATYSSLMPSGWFGNKDYPTFSTQSVIIVNKDWKEAHADLYNSVLGSINSAMPAMVKAAEPTQ